MSSDHGVKTMTIISGKGGTGKTSLAACFAVLGAPMVLADCDVDAANLHLVLAPENVVSHEFWAMPIARIRQEDCTSCGTCHERCRYDAISVGKGAETYYTIDPMRCEACLVCQEVCPEDAIQTIPRLAGHWHVAEARTGPLVHAHLGVAQENSGRLVTEVRKAAATIAAERGVKRVIVDGPPGTGCAVIASITGSDSVLAVTEATQSGKSDLMRVHDLARHFKVPLQVVINKSDLNAQVTRELKDWGEREGVEIVGELPYDPIVTQAMIFGRAIVEHGASPIAARIEQLWEKLSQQ